MKRDRNLSRVTIIIMDLFKEFLIKQGLEMANILLKDYGYVVMRHKDDGWGAVGSSYFGRVDNSVKHFKEILKRAAVKPKVVSIKPKKTDPGHIGEKRTYRMNTSKFRRKAIAYALLRKSLRFLAFYTISFPQGMSDDVAFRILNKVLTRSRRDLNLKSYLWVTEYQKNGTIHYHLLTNDYMNVVDLNRMFAIAIENEVEKGNASWGNSSFLKYNGVDVKRVKPYGREAHRNIRINIAKQVVAYLAKYMSKNAVSSYHRVWFCSRLVSALFTATWIDEADLREAVETANLDPRKFRVIECEFATVVFCVLIETPLFYDNLTVLNDAVYEYFDTNNLF